MKKAICLTAAILIVSISSIAFAGEAGIWKGWIADEPCAKNYAKVASAGHAGCAKACVKKGAKWALATKDGAFILEMDGSEAEKHLGHEVTVEGKLHKESKTIKVSSVSAAS